METIIILTFIIWNLVVFTMMGIDKSRAKSGSYRISEKRLLTSAFLFGGIGGTLGMNIFRHKTKHWYFRIGFPFLAIIQLSFLLYFFSTNIL